MSKVRLTLVLVTVFAVAAAVAGCGSSTGSGSSTTSSAPATTSTATTDTTTTTTSAATRTAKTTTAARATATAVAAGKTYFDNACQGCHSASGTEAGVGPKLTAAGLTADRVRNQVENGGDIMPPGLASGTDLDNVVAYVLSIQ